MKIILITIFFLLNLFTPQANIFPDTPTNDKEKITEHTNTRSESIAFSEKEWKKIQRKIRKNKRKYSHNAEVIRISKKVVDTVYLSTTKK